MQLSFSARKQEFIFFRNNVFPKGKFYVLKEKPIKAITVENVKH